MPVGLREAMGEMLAGWRSDLAPAWRGMLGDAEPDLDGVDPALRLEHWEPVFPIRRGRTFPGAPRAAHMFRALDDIDPDQVRCVILGQDPYPAPDFATGRAFEAGNVANWRELDKMFSKSVRAFMQLVCAARTGDGAYARSFADWPTTLQAIESGRIALEPADRIADRWVAQGALLLNASLTLSRFAVETDPHQSRGHLPLWRPVMKRMLSALARSGKPIVFIAFGDIAADTLEHAGVSPDATVRIIARDHPARADAVLALENPFVACNALLEEMGGMPIAW